ncbi:hypothetical protein Cni_G13381 [Canna indica]|uniref:cellulase n=1 Tax=Canna indica TaxID=4628 RepID=A0AAQ3K9S8_9LILI|nr:hypothetical protein Cni_G13381 [Canna indica]
MTLDVIIVVKKGKSTTSLIVNTFYFQKPTSTPSSPASSPALPSPPTIITLSATPPPSPLMTSSQSMASSSAAPDLSAPDYTACVQAAVGRLDKIGGCFVRYNNEDFYFVLLLASEITNHSLNMGVIKIDVIGFYSVLLLATTAMMMPYCSEGLVHSNYVDTLNKCIMFYEGQQSSKLRPSQRPTWQKDSSLNDSHDLGVDMTGEYYNAEDNMKFGFPMAFNTCSVNISVYLKKFLLAEMKGIVSVFVDRMLKTRTTRSWDFLQFPQNLYQNLPLERDVIIYRHARHRNLTGIKILQ